MGDSVFHIVDKGDGEIEIVQLVQRFNCSNVKIKNNLKFKDKIEKYFQRKDDCDCVMCQPILGACPTKLEDEKNEKTEISALKNYSRPKIRNDAKKKMRLEEANDAIINKPIFVHNKDPETDEVTISSITIKTEPEIEIVDQDETELVTEKESINLQESSSFTETGVIKQPVQKLPKLQKVVKPNSLNNKPKSSIESGPNKNLLLELATKNLKCNICGMEFFKSDNQLQTLRTHFFQHKTSTKRVIKTYTGIKYNTVACGKFENLKDSPIQKPSILNKEVKSKGDSQNEGRKDLQLQIMKDSLLISDVVPKLNTSSTGNIAKRKVINLKKVSLSSLKNKDFVIGNTVIKNVKSTANSKRDQNAEVYVEHSGAQQNKAVDLDDDIEIVEQKPELIVIDDNDGP